MVVEAKWFMISKQTFRSSATRIRQMTTRVTRWTTTYLTKDTHYSCKLMRPSYYPLRLLRMVCRETKGTATALSPSSNPIGAFQARIKINQSNKRAPTKKTTNFYPANCGWTPSPFPKKELPLVDPGGEQGTLVSFGASWPPFPSRARVESPKSNTQNPGVVALNWRLLLVVWWIP